MSTPFIPTAIPALSRPVSRFAPGALKWLWIVILAAAPLPLGSTRPTAWSVLALTNGLLLLLATFCEPIERTQPAASAALRLPVLLAALDAIWIALQSLPLASAAQLSPIWNMAAQALGSPVHPSVSLDREESLGHLLRLLAYGASFLIAWRVAGRSEGAEALLRTIGLVGAAYALYGLIVYFTGNATVLWFDKWAYRTDLTGSFVNRNSFATFLGLGLIANLALMARILVERLDARSWRTLVESLIEAVFWRGGWLSICMIITGSALLFTHSRGGGLASILGAAALVLCTLSAPSLRGPWRASFAVLAMAGAAILLGLYGGEFFQRIGSTAADSDVRIDFLTGTLTAIGQNQLFGTGLGTFKYVYAPYQNPSIGNLVDLAHDDYLENVLELGIPAALIFYMMLSLLVLECLKGVFRRRRNAIFACAGVGASVLVGFHAAVDFSMQAPAVAITYATLLGVGVAQSIGQSLEGSSRRQAA